MVYLECKYFLHIKTMTSNTTHAPHVQAILVVYEKCLEWCKASCDERLNSVVVIGSVYGKTGENSCGVFVFICLNSRSGPAVVFWVGFTRSEILVVVLGDDDVK